MTDVERLKKAIAEEWGGLESFSQELAADMREVYTCPARARFMAAVLRAFADFMKESNGASPS